VSIKIEVTNVSAVRKALRDYGARAETEIGKAVQATALNINRDIKVAIQGPPKTGTVYQRGNVSHRASAPGEAPATDTGRLVSSIAYKQTGQLSAEVFTLVPYGYYLEYGTTKIAPRPAWVPATEKSEPLLNRLAEAAIRRAAQ
jgi:hypothetical protein